MLKSYASQKEATKKKSNMTTYAHLPHYTLVAAARDTAVFAGAPRQGDNCLRLAL